MTLQVVVVGGGIVGAAITHQVARIGAKVRVLDSVVGPGQGGATGSTWAWINANKKHPRHYRDLNLAGLERWKAEWPQLVHPCGSLLFDDEEESAGGPPAPDPAYPFQRLSPEQVHRLEPQVAAAAAARGAHLYPQEAWVDPQQACREMLRRAEELGAQVLLGPGHRVERLLTDRTRGGGGVEDPSLQQQTASSAAGPSRVTGVLTADGATHPADVVLLAAGAAVQPLAAQVGVDVPMLHKPAVSAVTHPLRPPPTRGSASSADPSPSFSGRLVHHLLASSQVFVWERPDGSVILGDTKAHEDGSAAWGESLLDRARELVPALRAAGARVDRVQVAYRPWPKDGHPVVGGSSSCRGLYVATMHSGVTLAPEVARLVAEELQHWDVAAGAARGDHPDLRAAQEVLAPYRLDRDFEEGAARAAYGWK